MALNLVPTSGSTLDNTRDPIYNNFSYINSQFAVNHVNFNNGGDSGKHIMVEMVINTLQATAGATEYILSTNGTNLLLQGPNVSYANALNLTAASANTDGYTVFPSGIKIAWATYTGLWSGDTTIGITFVNDPGFTTAIYSVQLTPTTTGTPTVAPNFQPFYTSTAIAGGGVYNLRFYAANGAGTAAYSGVNNTGMTILMIGI